MSNSRLSHVIGRGDNPAQVSDSATGPIELHREDKIEYKNSCFVCGEIYNLVHRKEKKFCSRECSTAYRVFKFTDTENKRSDEDWKLIFEHSLKKPCNAYEKERLQDLKRRYERFGEFNKEQKKYLSMLRRRREQKISNKTFSRKEEFDIEKIYPARPHSGGTFNLIKPSEEWLYQPKYNGWRALVDLHKNQIFNRFGEPMQIGDCFVRSIESIRNKCIDAGIRYLDCEAMERKSDTCRGALILIDLPNFAEPFDLRMEVISSIAKPHVIDEMPKINTSVLAPTFKESEAGKLWGKLQKLNLKWGYPIYSGIVAKKIRSKYPDTLEPEDTFQDWVKFRFDS